MKTVIGTKFLSLESGKYNITTTTRRRDNNKYFYQLAVLAKTVLVYP